MTYDDAIYGRQMFDEPVLLDLLESAAVNRLHGVLQHGITAVLGITSPITRFQHSVGAMLLVRRVGGTLREQIAALLHDVSHTAFSHVIDHVFHDQGTQSFHERKKEWWIEQTDVPAVLARHGLNWHDFLEDEPYPLLEQPLPRLCADRLDYFLRDGTGMGVIAASEVEPILAHLVVRDGRMAIDDLNTARLLGERFMAADNGSWSNPVELVLYELAARAIRAALERRLLTDADLWGTDAALWDHLRASTEPEVARWVRLTERRPEFVDDLVAPTIRIRPKVRAIDPDVVSPFGLRPLSEVDPEFARKREDYVRRKTTGLSVRLLE
ncbi:MAG TPA: HD domain-containing protein [Gemmataceae bacterium]|jgi:HD superfamily phosphohydrolase|nr:HD domain-containing protein [Gemmataceae bacterium]